MHGEHAKEIKEKNQTSEKFSLLLSPLLGVNGPLTWIVDKMSLFKRKTFLEGTIPLYRCPCFGLL